MSEDKGQEQHEVENRGDIVDHISNLPDSILHDHILSLLPTKQVVRTSILSKRWKNLWASLPNIDLDDALLHATEIDDGPYPPKVTSFMNFSERVLRLRGALNIKKFKLTSYGFSNFTPIHSWISDAILHNVQELDLRLLRGNGSLIPWSMLHSTSLATLKISTNCLVILPSHISFPCLKTLHLSTFTFLNDDSIQKLLSGCPALEELDLSDLKWKDARCIVISSSTLKSLRIYDPLYFESININAANLIRFDYNGYLPNKILLNNASSLAEVCIHVDTSPKTKEEAACQVVDLLKNIRYTMSLWVSNWTIESLEFADKGPDLFPVFPNLIHLTLTSEIKHYAFWELMDLLSFCPVLQSICFSEGFVRKMNRVENNSIWFPIPICMKKCLKRLTLKKFHGYNSEICFLQFVLKYACVLERMDMWWSAVADVMRAIKVTKELEKIERSSTACVINFS